MSRYLRPLLIAAFCTVSAFAQEVVETGNGSYRIFTDQQGRHARHEGSDGVVVEYRYATAAATSASSVVVHVGNVDLRVGYEAEGTLDAPGLPKITTIYNADHRATELRADAQTLATFTYAKSGYVTRVAMPQRMTLRLTPPDAAHHVRQRLFDARGKQIASANVRSRPLEPGVWRRTSFETVASALSFDARALTFESSPTGSLMTGRDADGRVALYIVTAGGDSVGFTPDGIARFYDLSPEILDVDIPAGSDAGTSKALEQIRALPSHITLTASGDRGMYVEEPGEGAIHAAWTEGKTVVRNRLSVPGR
ncbi:MAG: hypothetical protein M3Q69_10530 [Acidobacteriota bacterium]|nr:hypothetical protein [Acidobacteriota bacterium]